MMRPEPVLAREVSAAPTLASVRGFLLRALRQEPSPGTILLVTVPAPVAEPDALLAARPDAEAVLWHPPEGASCAGIGVAARVEVHGTDEDRFAHLRRESRRLFARVSPLVHPDVTAPPPRLFGGAAFAPGAASEEPWSSFGDGCFVLPRWTYVREGDSASLTLAVDAASPAEQLAAEELDHLWGQLARPRPSLAPAVEVCEVSHLSADRWAELVEGIRAAIAAGDSRKVVAARRSEVSASGAIDALGLLGRLRRHFAGCTRFAMRRGDTTFLGATPERLVTLRGTRVATEALAGTVALGHATELLESEKDRVEHQLVVDAIVSALEPWCRRIERDDAPRIRELPNVLHMQTRIVGELHAETHVLDLVAALHPTPAVGGVPRTHAIDWIAAHEAAPRGWYSAPFGWVDARGDGDLVVALRSGVVRGERAWVYAGAGIVQDSRPDAEYAETDLKMGALLGALSGGW